MLNNFGDHQRISFQRLVNTNNSALVCKYVANCALSVYLFNASVRVGTG